MSRSFPRLSPVGDKRTPATTPLLPASNSATGSPGDCCGPKKLMITCTCAEHYESRHQGCEGEIEADLKEEMWFRNKNNPKKNWYCPYCWRTCLAEYGGGSVAEEEREQKKEAAAASSSDWVFMNPWKSHWDFEMEQVDFWIESVPCSNCGNVYLRGQMYVGKKQKTMWCHACEQETRGAGEPCFIKIAEAKYTGVPAREYWNWMDWVLYRGVEERQYGPGFGYDENALGKNWNAEVFEKTENAASQKCPEKSAKRNV